MTTKANSTSRRHFLAGSAAIAAGAAIVAPAVALQSDPIFAAIEVHKAARRLVYSAVDAVSAMEAQLASEGITGSDRKGNERLEEREAALHLAFEAETEAACVLVNDSPTTIAGVIALLKYANAADTDGEGWPSDLQSDDESKTRSWHYFLIESLAEVLPGMVQA